MRFTMLHGKGLLMVGFVVYAENLATVNAVSFWSQFQRQSSPNNHHQYQHNQNRNGGEGVSKNKGRGLAIFAQAVSTGECDATNSKTCGPSQMNSPKEKQESVKFYRSTARAGRRILLPAEDCCLQCTDCMSSKQVQSLCQIRGGGEARVAADAGAAAAAAALAVTTPYNISLNVWKIIFQFILTSINVICWLGPLKNKKFSENKLGLSLANAFSGGVFLSLAFGHFLPECVHGFQGYNEALPFMVCLGGYLLIFFVEKVAFDTHSILEGGDHGHSSDSKKEVTSNSVDNNAPANSLGNGRGAVILLGALAVHSILEMTALGLANSFSDAGILTLSIALHQPAESIALLVAFLKSGLSEGEIIKYLSIFSAMGPIGVAIGMAIKEFSNELVDAIVLATVAGTFIYVGATEVIPEEWEDSEHKWKKFFCLISGIVSIFGITQYSMSLEGH